MVADALTGLGLRLFWDEPGCLLFKLAPWLGRVEEALERKIMQFEGGR